MGRFSSSNFIRWVTLPVLGIVVIAVIFHYYGLGISVLTDVALFGWLCCAPGILLVYLIAQWSKHQLNPLELTTLGSALGLWIQPFFFSILRLFGAWKFDFFVTDLFILLLVVLAFLAKRKTIEETSFPYHQLWTTGWSAVIIVFLFLGWYNFPNFHFAPTGSLVTRSLFGVDIPWLIGEVASIKNFGDLRDLHQYALPWSYHESTYQLIASVSRITHSEIPSVVAFSAPVFG